MGDMRAQEGALLKGEQRLRDVLTRYGFDGVSQAMELLIESRGEEGACRDPGDPERRV